MSDTLKIANSIWPNGMKVDSDGHAVFYPLGTNKVKVPTSLSEWPKGDKLVSPFVYDKDDKLVGFVDTKALTTDSQTTIYLPYEHIEAEFSSIYKGLLQIHAPKATTKKASWKNSGVEDITEAQFKYKGCKTVYEIQSVDNYYLTADIVNGTWSEPLWDLTNSSNMFENCSNLTTFSSELPSLTDGCSMFAYSKLSSFSSDLSKLENGISMFYSSIALTSFSSDLSSLYIGEGMFADCSNLTSFSSDLPNLSFGHCMFYQCANLTSFSSDLSSLTNGSDMFYNCENLESFTSDLSSLTHAHLMFCRCKNITSFNSDLSSLESGNGMFEYCYNLFSFTSDLSSLTNGSYMFVDTKLDTASVQNIADTIKDVNGVVNDCSAGIYTVIHIGIGNSEPNEQEEAAFNTIASKGWTVYVNGSEYTPTSPAAITTLDETGEEITTPIPFWAKPVQSDEETATYTDEQGNFFNILGAQFIYGDDLSTYGMFTCEADAAVNMRLTPYIKPQTEIENQ